MNNLLQEQCKLYLALLKIKSGENLKENDL